MFVERMTGIEPAWSAWKPSTSPRELRKFAWDDDIERPGATWIAGRSGSLIARLLPQNVPVLQRSGGLDGLGGAWQWSPHPRVSGSASRGVARAGAVGEQTTQLLSAPFPISSSIQMNACQRPVRGPRWWPVK